MKVGPPPLRFVGAVVAAWVCVRAALLVPGWAGKDIVAVLPPAIVAPARGAVRRLRRQRSIPELRRKAVPSFSIGTGPAEEGSAHPGRTPALIGAGAAGEPRAAASGQLERPSVPVAPMSLGWPPSPQPGKRWSVSAWLLARRGEGGQLGTGGTLGGSQLGARFLYAVNERAGRPLAVSARVYAPLGASGGAEAALGIDWKPLPGMPLRLLVERRQALGHGGRSAFAFMVYGGVSDEPIVGPLSLDAYVQGGVVGAMARDRFVDGSARLTLPLGPRRQAKAGLGLWGAAQPGVSRLDIGPHLSVALPLKRAGARLSAEWRFRIAGHAAPASGPALTLSADF